MEIEINPISSEPEIVVICNEKPVGTKANLIQFVSHLNQIHSNFVSIHTLTENYEYHKIFGDLKDSLFDLLDTLQEEIIGIVKSCDYSLSVLPVIDVDSLSIDVYQTFSDDVFDSLDSYKYNVNLLYSLITSVHMKEFLESCPTKNGIDNTLQEIYSLINKSDYLLKMVKTQPSSELIAVKVPVETQADKFSDYPIQKILNPQV